MSKRSLKKRRHRPDFPQYLESVDTNKATSNLWKQYGFKSNSSFQVALKQAMADQAAKRDAEATMEEVTVEQGETHVHTHEHGEGCHHE